MITAPDVFATDSEGHYTPEVAVDWVAQRTAVASPLFIGRTLRYTADNGWEFGPAKAGADPTWKPMSDAPKTLSTAFASVKELPETTGYYELVGPKLARNPHKLDDVALVRHGIAGGADFMAVPTTSLFALIRTWFPAVDHLGILWSWDEGTDDPPRFAAVRRSRLPAA